jgi:hypothetical protein
MNQTEEKESLSRRDALKTLAAITGAISLSSLPGKWDTPLIQVGSLPVHAQGSAGTLVLNNSSTGECEGDIGWTGSLSYNAPAGVDTFEVEHTFLGAAGPFADIVRAEFALTGDLFSGTFFPSFCINFDGANAILFLFYFEDTNGFISTQVGPIRVSNPSVTSESTDRTKAGKKSYKF